MFASTLEYMLRNFTADFEDVKGQITSDGSMHTFWKEFHIDSLKDLDKFSEKIKISTPLYPFSDADFNEILAQWPGNLNKSKNICIRAKDIRDSELNLLFQFYKIVKGTLNIESAIFGKDSSKNFAKWNPSYLHWSDMQKWELREWFSTYYPDYVTEWIDVEKDINQFNNFLLINNIDILNNLDVEFTKIINHCGLTEDKTKEYFDFISNWIRAQQYILKEFELIDKIVKKTLENLEFDWSDDRLCIISECIIQKRLRDSGYEIKCHNLNNFPTNSEQLYKLLEKR
jgi:hypothetical protein